jgi:hypothetical protein
MLDIRRALEFLTDDERAQNKLGIGALLMIVPLANIAAIGYEVEVARRVARAEPRPLPEWNDLGGLFVSGAWLSLARLVYTLPIVAVAFAMAIAGLALALQDTQSARQQFDALGSVFAVGVVCLVGGLFIYGFILGFLYPAILAEYARRGTFAACFDLAAITRFIRRDPGQYALAWLAEIGLGLALGLVGFVAGLVLSAIPCLGSLALMFIFGLAAFVVLMFNSHLAGQLMRADTNAVLA